MGKKKHGGPYKPTHYQVSLYRNGTYVKRVDALSKYYAKVIARRMGERYSADNGYEIRIEVMP